MKKTKLLIAILAIILVAGIFCVNFTVFATEETTNPNARTASSNEPVVISDDQTSNQDNDIHDGDLFIVADTTNYTMDKLVDRKCIHSWKKHQSYRKN